MTHHTKNYFIGFTAICICFLFCACKSGQPAATANTAPQPTASAPKTDSTPAKKNRFEITQSGTMETKSLSHPTQNNTGSTSARPR